jgi:hypothetical protein
VAVGVGVTVLKKPQNEGRLPGNVQAVRIKTRIKNDKILFKRIDFSNKIYLHHTVGFCEWTNNTVNKTFGWYGHAK